MMNAVPTGEPIVTLASFFRQKGYDMPKIVKKKLHRGRSGPAGRVRPKKRLDGPELPEQLTLRQFREDVAKLTLVQMADEIGAPKSTYWFWEQGNRPIPPRFQTRINGLVLKYAPQPAVVANGHTNGTTTEEAEGGGD